MASDHNLPKKTYLPSDTEEEYRKLSRRQVLKKLIPAVCWFVLDLACWFAYAAVSGKPVTHPGSIFFTILLILPFYPFRIHLLLWQETFYGTVADLRYERKMITDWTAKTNRRYKDVFVLYIRTDEGLTEKLYFITNDDIRKCAYYRKDDRVLKLKGVKFPVKITPPDPPKVNLFYQPDFSKPEKREISNTPHRNSPVPAQQLPERFCPVCGTHNEAEREHCHWCREKLIS